MGVFWRYVGEPGADGLPPWLLVGPGDQAVMHRVSVLLARMRQSRGIEGDVGFVSVDLLLEEDDSEAVRRALEVLREAGMAELRVADGVEMWRASVDLVGQIDEAFSARPANPVVADD